MDENLLFFNRFSYHSHATTLWRQISTPVRYYIHLFENQSPNWAPPRPLPSVVQAASGLTLSRGSRELWTVLGPDKALVLEGEVKTRQIEKKI